MAWSIFTDGGGDSVAVAWARQLLQRINAPVTPGNIEFIYQWEKAEGGGGKYNPLNQGPVPNDPTLTTTGSQYGGGAADYASWDAGLVGATDYLNMPNYTAVLAALKANDPNGARQALWASPWAASHYGYGANWPNVPLPGNSSTAVPIDFGTGAGTGSSTTTASDTGTAESIGYNAKTCAWGIATPSISGGIQPGLQGWKQLWDKFFGGGNKPSPPSGICFLSNSAARALIGGMIIGSGAIITGLGVVTLLAYGLQRSSAVQQISRVPGLGTVVRVIR